MASDVQKFVGTDEVKTVKFWKSVTAEVLSTAIMMIVQCSVPLKWPGNNDSGTTVQIALGMGFVVMCMIEAFGHISGAQMNPSVSIAMLIARKISLLKAIFYIIAQCSGAFLGSGLIYIITPANATGGLATTTVNRDMTPAQGMVVEMYLTFMLVFVIFGATDSRKKITMPSLVIGMAVAMNICTGINHTGASMNPARSLGPAVYVNIWTDHWVYWAGPISGAILATLAYNFGFVLHCTKKEKELEEEKKYAETLPDPTVIERVCGRYCGTLNSGLMPARVTSESTFTLETSDSTAHFQL
ncbi:aquaporin AQPAe.a isoform X2 [Lingula anatina]|nr:aquaporin AQPAe.a isoform X2 [Lingula anatina]XP_013390352.1 aquaporin AQPAe.a isoform X2 [Lingula anatina]XP_013390360.1 aquaporin AQPAe.a isoform X2 [Lingula anatina]|eukprot:XP_013390344.1 aquaporin AQPAe.a isoform X2 [Lingula anatina]